MFTTYNVYIPYTAHWINVIYDFIYTEFIVLLAALINKLLSFVGSFNNKKDSILWLIDYVSALSFNLYSIFHQNISSKRDYTNETTKLPLYSTLFQSWQWTNKSFQFIKEKQFFFTEQSRTNTTCWLLVYYECNSTDICVGKMLIWVNKPFKWKIFNFHECANLT